MPLEREELTPYVGSVVVVDTSTPYVYAGLLKAVHDHVLVLTDADVHDCSEGRSGKDLYLLEARRNGVQKNRREVVVRTAFVVSLSKIDDIILY